MKHSSLEEAHYPTIEASQFEMGVAGAEEAGFQDKANMLKVHNSSRSMQLPPTTTSAPRLPSLTKRFKASTNQSRSLTIRNPHSSLMALIDAVYPPLHCTVCDHVSAAIEEANEHARRQKHCRELLCLHPHCEKTFRTRSALLFHIQQSHLVIQATITTIPPLITCATSSASSFSSSSSPTSAASTSASAAPATITATISPSLSPTPTTSAGDDNDSHSSSLSPSPQPSSSFPALVPTPSPPKKPRSPTWRVSSFPKIQATRAPRGSKKIVLSPEIDIMLNSVYHPLQCPSCHKQFNRKTNVIKHLTDEHYGEEPYRCIFPECSHPKLYATREGLVYHILRVHDSNNPSQPHSQQEQQFSIMTPATAAPSAKRRR